MHSTNLQQDIEWSGGWFLKNLQLFVDSHVFLVLEAIWRRSQILVIIAFPLLEKVTAVLRFGLTLSALYLALEFSDSSRGVRSPLFTLFSPSRSNRLARRIGHLRRLAQLVRVIAAYYRTSVCIESAAIYMIVSNALKLKRCTTPIEIHVVLSKVWKIHHDELLEPIDP